MSLPFLVEYTLRTGAAPPTRSHKGDAGWDLYGLESVVIRPGRYERIDTGVCLAPNHNIWFMLMGRSSSLARGLQIFPAVIDSGYRGEMFVTAANISRDIVHVTAGERIAQLVPYHHVPTEWQLVCTLPDSERGERGVGSTGR